MIAPGDAGHEPEGRGVFEREIGVGAKGACRPPHQRPRGEVRDEADEVAAVGIEPAEDRRVALAARLIAVIADGLQGDHEPDVVAPLAGGLRIDHAALIAAEKERRLLVDEGHETYGHGGGDPGEKARELQQGSHAAAIVVRAGTSPDAVVVGAQQQNLVGSMGPGTRHFEICAGDALRLVDLPRHLVALGLPDGLDVIGGRSQRSRAKDVALADLAGEPVDVLLQTLLLDPGGSLRL